MVDISVAEYVTCEAFFAFNIYSNCLVSLSGKRTLGIVDYSLSQSTLEQVRVFLFFAVMPINCYFYAMQFDL